MMHITDNTPTAKVMEIKSQQASMLESQTSIIQNQGLVLDQFATMQIRMDHMEQDQHEILWILKSQLPQPPPSGSNM